MGINTPIVSFVGGEIGAETMARVDLSLYASTAEVMENILPVMRGALVKAPGTEFIGEVSVADHDKAVVRPFVFNVDNTRVLEIVDSEIRIVDGNGYVTIIGAAATVGAPLDNGSSGGSSVTIAAPNVTYDAVAGGEAKAYWPITSGVSGSPTTFSFEVRHRAIKFSVGTTTGGEDILGEITLDPGIHILTVSPTASSYYLRARLTDAGMAKVMNMARKAAGKLVIPTPYTGDELRRLRFEQSNDIVWVYHPNHRTRVIERRGDTSWSLRLFAPQNGPFEVQNITSTTLTPSAINGSAVVNSSKALFSSTCVGQLLELIHQGQTEILSATAVDQATDAVRIIGVGDNRAFTFKLSGTFAGSIKLQRSAGNTVDWVDYATYSAATTVAINDGLDNQIIYYRAICSAYTSGSLDVSITYAGGETVGRCEISEYTSSTSVKVEISENFGSIASTSRWSIGSWSDDYGWPAAGQIAEGRHWLVRDDRLWGSQSDDYENMTVGSNDADAIARVIGTGDVNEARWIEGGARVIIGTSGAEIQVMSNDLGDKLTWANMNARPFGDEGSSDVQAVRASGKRILFIDRTRAKLLQCYLDSDAGDMETDDLTRLHEKIAGEIEEGSGDGFIELAYQRSPEKRAWLVRSDGQIAVQLYAPKEGIYGWGRITGANGGKFKSVCVIPGVPEDRVHVLVERTVNGVAKLYHERFALNNFPISVDDDGNRSAPKAWRLQCALATSGAATTEFSNLGHLEGETVHVWGDGRYMGSYTVTGGAISLLEAASYVIIGLNYRGKWKSSFLMTTGRNGTALTQNKIVGALGMIVHDTPIGAVRYGRDFSVLDDLVDEFADGVVMDQAATLTTGAVNQPFEGATEIDSRVCIVMDLPAPARVLALVPNIELEEID